MKEISDKNPLSVLKSSIDVQHISNKRESLTISDINPKKFISKSKHSRLSIEEDPIHESEEKQTQDQIDSEQHLI